MRRVVWWAIWLTTAATAAEPLVAVGFEVGLGECRVGASRWALDASVAAEGRCALRVDAPAELSLPPQPCDVGAGYTLSLWLRADRPGVQATLALGASESFGLTEDWRRYVLTTTVQAARPVPRVSLSGPARAQVWLDGWQVAPGDDSGWVRRPALGLLPRGLPLVEAGSDPKPRVLLDVPESDAPVPLTWRLENGRGETVRRGGRQFDLVDGRAADELRAGALGPGLWRYVVSAWVGSGELTASWWVAATDPQLGAPGPWLTVDAPPHEAWLPALGRLRVGTLRFARWEPELLRAARRAGFETLAPLPADGQLWPDVGVWCAASNAARPRGVTLRRRWPVADWLPGEGLVVGDVGEMALARTAWPAAPLWWEARGADAASVAQQVLLAREARCAGFLAPPEPAEPPAATAQAAVLGWAMTTLRGRRVVAAGELPGGLRYLLWHGHRPLATLWHSSSVSRPWRVTLPASPRALTVTDATGCPGPVPLGTTLRLVVGALPWYVEWPGGREADWAALWHAARVERLDSGGGSGGWGE